MIDINDLSLGRNVEQIINNYLKIYDRIEKGSPFTEVIVQSLLPVNDVYGLFAMHTNKGDFILEINKPLKAICTQRGCTYMDLFSKKMVDDQGRLRKDLSVDHLHLNSLDYQDWKQGIEHLIRVY